MQVNAILTATNTAGKDIKTTITYLRQSQENKAEQLAQALNALTTNVYKSTQINEINIDPSTDKKGAVITIGDWVTGSSNYRIADVYYNGTKQTESYQPVSVQGSTSNVSINYFGQVQGPPQTSGILYSADTEQYYPAILKFTSPA